MKNNVARLVSRPAWAKDHKDVRSYGPVDSIWCEACGVRFLSKKWNDGCVNTRARKTNVVDIFTGKAKR